MGIVIGRHMPQETRVSIAHRKTVRQVEFATPSDFLWYVDHNPEAREQIMNFEWQWTTQKVEGGH